MTDRAMLKGLTWDHPRAYQGLEAETKRFNRMQDRIWLSWDRQSLRAFEEKSIEVTAAEYDLVVLDHPFMGDAAATGCLLDLRQLPELLDLEPLSTAFVGPSFSSYVYEGGVWALPLDAACQTAVMRPDLLERYDESAPSTLEELFSLARRHQIALAMSCPHAFMNFLTICGLLGADISGEGERLVPRRTGIEALDLFRELVAKAAPEVAGWSSVAMLDAMADRDDLAYCPMVFCFNSYARLVDHRGRNRLAFANPIEMRVGGGCAGAVAGGTGLAISSSSRLKTEAAVILAYLTSAETQFRMAIEGGQPARRDTWDNPNADHANGSLFSSTIQTMSGALVRPRYPGYIALQNRAGDILKAESLDRSRPAAMVIDEIEAVHRAICAYKKGQSAPT